MKIIKNIRFMQNLVENLPKSIGLVATMGGIHQGHLALIKKSIKENSTTIVSLFVNPAQFNKTKDFIQYPRNIKKDLKLLESLKIDILFSPNKDEIYPENFYSSVSIANLENKLEGMMRPDHFKGVATVVIKLLNITNPDKAYFGQKDAQQSIIIKKMTEDLNLKTKILIVPIVRDENGLAYSSRNEHLTKQELKEASNIYWSLKKAATLYNQGINNPIILKKEIERKLSSMPNLKNIDYVSIANPETLDELTEIKENTPFLISTAVYLGNTRLIDNILVK